MIDGDHRANGALVAAAVVAEDGRRAVTYIVTPEPGEYIAIMSVLEAFPVDLTPAEVAASLCA